MKGQAHKHVLQGVHRRLEIRSLAGNQLSSGRGQAGTDSSRWTEGATPREGGRRCQIVLIGRQLTARRQTLEVSATEALGACVGAACNSMPKAAAPSAQPLPCHHPGALLDVEEAWMDD